MTDPKAYRTEREWLVKETKPKKRSVELYGDGIGRVELVEHMGSDLTIVNSARVSYGKHKEALDEKDERLINYLVKHRHTSRLSTILLLFALLCLSLCVASITDTELGATMKSLVRYTDINIQFYEPEQFRTQHKSNRQASNENELIDPIILGFEDGGRLSASSLIKRHHEHSFKLFEDLIEAGVCREQARGVLPQNMYTEYYGTVNLSNLLKFIDLRTHEGAQWEIQKVAEACLDIAEDLWPVAVSSYRNSKNEKDSVS
jgi:thymidylate synthase (FAD)